MARTIGYRWHLRRLMADKDMYATTQLRPLLAERGVALSREQVYRLVTGVPERLSLATLAALCDILGCGPGDLVEPVLVTVLAAGPPPGPPRPAAGAPAGACPGDRHRPPVVAVAGRCPSGHELAWPLGGRLPALPPGDGHRGGVGGGPVTARGSDRGRSRGGSPGRAGPAAAGGRAGRRSRALTAGAPPVAGRLAPELIARGSAALAVPACAVCGRAGRPLFRGDGGGVCQRCRSWQLAGPAPPAARPAARPGSTSTAGRSARFAAAGITRAATANAQRAGTSRRSRCAAGTGSRTSASTATGCPGHLQQMPAAAQCTYARPPAHLPLVLATGHRRLRALRARPATGSPLARGTGLRPVLPRGAAATGAGAHPAASNGGWSPRPARRLTPAPTAPGSRSPTPARTAGPKTSSTKKAAAPGAACAAAPAICCRPAPGPSPWS